MSINFFYENPTTSFKEYMVKSSFSNLSLFFFYFYFFVEPGPLQVCSAYPPLSLIKIMYNSNKSTF
jgi:hypothetical protein